MHVDLVWDEYNVGIIRGHGLTESDINYAVMHGATDADVSNMSGWPVLFGSLPDGRTVAVIFQWEDDESIYVLDAKTEE